MRGGRLMRDILYFNGDVLNRKGVDALDFRGDGLLNRGIKGKDRKDNS